MSGIPSFALILKQTEIPVTLNSCWDAGGLVDHKLEAGEAWETCFENEWHVPLMAKILATYGLSSLDYLLKEVSLVEAQAIPGLLRDFESLLHSLRRNPSAISHQFYEQHFSPSETATALASATATKSVNDENYHSSVEAFCAFLVSQHAALCHAAQGGDALLHVQFHG